MLNDWGRCSIEREETGTVDALEMAQRRTIGGDARLGEMLNEIDALLFPKGDLRQRLAKAGVNPRVRSYSTIPIIYGAMDYKPAKL